MNRKYLVLAVAILTGLFFYSACTKLDTTDIGSDLIPEVDNVNTFDTVFNVITDNLLYPDSTRIGGTSLHAIGNIANDAEFGETNAAAYFQVVPAVFASHPFINRDSIKGIDSVVLQIPFSTLYGDSNAIEQFEVFEIDQSADIKDSVYPIEGNPFPVAGGTLGTKLVDFKTLNDSVFYTNYASSSSTVLDSVKTSHKLRIHLNPAWAAKFLTYDTAVEYKTDSAFRSHFKGLAVMVNKGASPAARALAYFALTGTPAATLTFYSRITKDGQIDTIAPVFSFTSRRSANIVKRTPGNNYAATLGNGNPSDNLAYIQSSPGSVITVKIPGLESLSNRVIHRAELIVERIPSAEDNLYPQAPLLFIDGINNAGDSTFTIRNDFVPTGQGTGYDLGSLEGVFKNEKYMFNISRYVQTIVTKKLPSRTLRIYAPYATWPFLESSTGTTSTLPFFLFVNSPIGAYRVVVGGGTHPTNKMRLRIIYSKI